MRHWVYTRLLRLVLAVYHVALQAATRVGRTRRPWRDGEGCEILLTGTFRSDNWISAHLRPLAASMHCARLSVVSTYPVPPVPKLELIQPPLWLRRVLGGVGARLVTFGWLAMRRRPHVVGGFHLLFNGLAAALVARLAGARSLYFCVGGPAEVLGGGIDSENRLFGRLAAPDPVVERQLIRAVSAFDLVITMGTRAVTFFRQRGVRGALRVVSGGMDPGRFGPATAEDAPVADAILVGRLAQIKRIDVFLQAIQRAAQRVPDLQAVIVGDGERRAELEGLAHELGVAGRVTFAGRRADVHQLLRRSRLFVLTSDSEGLALSLMEAMTCGLPAVVSDVGDLGDLVDHGQNGYLVPARDVDGFADAIVTLLTDERRRAAFGRAAQVAARRHELSAVTVQWNEILGNGVLR